jgi:hypothetical protein
MSQIIRTSRGSVATTALLLLLASLAFAGCGGSSSTSSSTAKTASPSTTTAKTQAGEQFAALRACLQKNGIPLPKNITAQSSSLAAILASLPKGVTRAGLEAAVKACGGLGSSGAGAGIGSVPGTSSPAYRQALPKFTSCMRVNGVSLGPNMSTKGLNTRSAKFKAALTKCEAILRSALARAGG